MDAGTRSTRILVADRHAVVRSGLKAILERRPDWRVVAEAGDGKEAVAKAVEARPDVAIVDHSLAIMNGIAVTQQIRAYVPATEILIFTIHDCDELLSDALLAGARAVLLKSQSSDSLVAAVDALSNCKPFFAAGLSEKLPGMFLPSRGSRPAPTLSPRERIVVQLIAEGNSNKEIGGIIHRSVKTIETHRAAAMRKLNVTTTAALVRYAVRSRLVEP
jgi:DNA-binding NarL/FixJ family response regulator